VGPPRASNAINRCIEPSVGFSAIDEIIRTEALTKRYEGPPGGFGPPNGPRPAGAAPAGPAVDRLDLEVRAGEIFGLLGPNGAGKTTTIGMLTTRVIPTSGAAFVGGIDVVAHPAQAKQLIGVVTQTNTLDRSLTVWENLYFHGRYFGLGARDSRQRADAMLQQFRLADRAAAEVATLSGGMAQRLMVARAILHRPSVLFLDEPTAGLDPQSRIALWEIIGDLKRQGQTILLTTHYMEEADLLCERVAIMDHGRILALDSPAGLKRSVDADTIVTVQAEGDQDALAAALGRMDGTTSANASAVGVQVHVRGGRGILPRVLAAAEDGGFVVNDIHVAEPTLETVFISLTGKDLRE
jgi:ABC-2 type transport system ATP-binding protein